MRMVLIALLILLSSPAFATDYCDTAVDSSAYFCLTFDSDWGAGQVPDQTSNGRDFNTVSADNPNYSDSSPTSFNVEGSGEGYADFDGSDKLTLSDTTDWGNTDATLIFWGQRHTTAWARIFYVDDTAMLVYSDSGRIAGEWPYNNEFQNTGANPVIDTWNHFALIHDDGEGSPITIYMNGVEPTTMLNGESIGVGMSGYTDDVIFFGARDNNSYMDGFIDDIGLFTEVKSGTDINAIYDYGLRGQADTDPTFHTIYGATLRGLTIEP